MKKLVITLGIFLLLIFFGGPASAAILFSDGFENSWTSDYASGWANGVYRHGDAPTAVMEQQTDFVRSGNCGMKLWAESVITESMFWAAVQVESLPHSAMARQYDPYVSAWYYDDLGVDYGGQVYAVPDWVNVYTTDGGDWTDVQYGARRDVADNYWYLAAGEGSPGWQDTGVARSEGWHNLKFQLSSADGYIYFYLDGVEVGKSFRNDYTNLGTELGLYTMFQPPLSDWGEDKPFTIWDDFEVGSSVPIPGAAWLLAPGLAGMLGLRRRFRA